MKTISTITVLAALMGTQAGAATFTVYTDRTAFETAAGASLTTETFDSVASDISFAGASATVGDITASADNTNSDYNKFDAVPVFPEVDGNGTTALNMFTTSTTDAALTFAGSIRAFGADFFNFNDSSRRTDISILGELFMPDVQTSGTLSFFGVISDMDFTVVDFLGVNNDVFGIDNVSYASVAPVPLPGTLPLFLGGLLGAGMLRRRKKS